MYDMKIPKLTPFLRIIGAHLEGGQFLRVNHFEPLLCHLFSHIIGEGIPIVMTGQPGPPETTANSGFFGTLINRVRLFLGGHYIGGWKR